MKHLKRLIMVITILAVFIVVINIVPWSPTKAKTDSRWIRQPGEAPLIIPHGGAKEMYPENTMYAFANTDMYDAFEIDLALTDDNILISHHDLDLALMANRPDLLVRDLKYSEIIDVIQEAGFPHVRNFNGSAQKEDYSNWTDQQILDAKIIPVPIEEVFQKYPDKLYILELKNTVRKYDDPVLSQISENNSKIAVEQLAYLVRKYNMQDKVLMASFDDSLVKNFIKETNDEIGTMAGSIDSAIFALLSYLKLDFFYLPKYEALSMPYNQQMGQGNINTMKKFPKFIQNILADIQDDGTYMFNMQRFEFQKDAQRKNMSMIYWTVNDSKDMIDLVKRGADGIITDDPELLQEIIDLYN